MEGAILEEFSTLNALSQKDPVRHHGGGYGYGVGYSGCGSAGGQVGGGGHFGIGGSGPLSSGGCGGASAVPEDSSLQKERLLRGEMAYTAMSHDAKNNEHFIEDQPNGVHFGVTQLLPKASPTEERERLLRRLEMCAKAREETTKIMSIRFAQRDTVKNDIKRERAQHLERLCASQRDRDERWSRKLQRSPFAVDLVAENQRIDEEIRVKDHIEQRRQRLLTRRNREAHNSIFKRATAETDELDQLRAEKRMMLEHEKQLKALTRVERSNARTAKIIQERRRQRVLKLEAGEGASAPAPPLSARGPHQDHWRQQQQQQHHHHQHQQQNQLPQQPLTAR
eukprot:TRINITY_DN5796_c0_g1_i1.p1 TRINITY_DN5796_c0_g1~~TRINITY_DN5796_c0_g1_i1.p1  ORF type:complete len:338 (+),score=75.90 TRINITY_DN5796_c0_g1_i1:56-1069(+)